MLNLIYQLILMLFVELINICSVCLKLTEQLILMFLVPLCEIFEAEGDFVDLLEK
jgi:hypothetical protein